VPRAKQRTPELRDKVLDLAVTAVNAHGISGFTTRRVAELAGTSVPGRGPAQHHQFRWTEPEALVFPNSEGGYMRGSNVRRRWWSQAVAAAQLFPQTVTDVAGKATVVYDFKLHEPRHTAASLAIPAGANITALQNMLGHESAGLTLDRYGHLYGSDAEAVGVAINVLLTRTCGQNVGTDGVSAASRPTLRAIK
jgi:integrase